MSKKKLADYIIGVDHIAVAVKDIEEWKREYLRMGGEIFHETPDAVPDGESSMHLCGIILGGISIALIQGIDRGEKSQVTKFVERFGDHGFQHVAVRVSDIFEFMEVARGEGYQFLTEPREREDSFGPVRQVFACKFEDALPADAAPFYEFVERPPEGEDNFNTAGKSFSDDFARKLYEDVEGASEATFIDYALRAREKSEIAQ